MSLTTDQTLPLPQPRPSLPPSRIFFEGLTQFWTGRMPSLPPHPPTPPCFNFSLRGGLIFWADLVGAPHIVKVLDGLAAKFDAVGAGGFFKPCDYLRQAAQQGRKLGAGLTASRM